MNTLDDTINTLLPDSQKLVQVILKASRRFFEEDQHVAPAAFAINAEGNLDVTDITEMSDQTKPQIWSFVRQLRQSHPIVAFISEVWTAKVDPQDVNPDGTVKVMPQDHPDKREQVLLTLWQGDRHVSFAAEIKRSPNRLDPWEVMFDSYFPKGKIDRVEGAMMDGEDYPLNQS